MEFASLGFGFSLLPAAGNGTCSSQTSWVCGFVDLLLLASSCWDWLCPRESAEGQLWDSSTHSLRPQFLLFLSILALQEGGFHALLEDKSCCSEEHPGISAVLGSALVTDSNLCHHNDLEQSQGTPRPPPPGFPCFPKRKGHGLVTFGDKPPAFPWLKPCSMLLTGFWCRPPIPVTKKGQKTPNSRVLLKARGEGQRGQLGQPGQDSQDRTARTARTGQPAQPGAAPEERTDPESQGWNTRAGRAPSLVSKARTCLGSTPAGAELLPHGADRTSLTIF
ncbi:uncharacterized protein LOC117005446 [Catharus ustulatus]|uniref:uncharacterized protein LOC117005446 n=1 Tax=Catharus ustulatus TaxID=91951 RepID=UPI001409B30D|nr:uncharacterized protein LOC117005446 [Catharus ustulatus]